MKLCRFQNSEGQIRVGLMQNGTTVLDLTAAGIAGWRPRWSSMTLIGSARNSRAVPLPDLLTKIESLAPLERQEVWAAGVTYCSGAKTRAWRSRISARPLTTRVYEAERPEIFFKSLAGKSRADRRARRHPPRCDLERAGAGARPRVIDRAVRSSAYTDRQRHELA